MNRGSTRLPTAAFNLRPWFVIWFKSTTANIWLMRLRQGQKILIVGEFWCGWRDEYSPWGIACSRGDGGDFARLFGDLNLFWENLLWTDARNCRGGERREAAVIGDAHNGMPVSMCVTQQSPYWQMKDGGNRSSFTPVTACQSADAIVNSESVPECGFSK